MAAEEGQEDPRVKEVRENVAREEDRVDAETLEALIGRGPVKPTKTDVERDIRLISVKGRSSMERKLMPVFDDAKKLAGYKAVDMDNPFDEIFDEDMTLANLDPEELNVTREHCNLSNFAQALSKSSKIPLQDCQTFYKNQMKSFLISSRAKKGFAAWMMKTEKSISEGTLQRIQKQVEERKNKKFLGMF